MLHFFYIWRQDPPPAIRLRLALLWWWYRHYLPVEPYTQTGLTVKSSGFRHGLIICCSSIFPWFSSGSWLLLKVRLTVLYITKSPKHKEGHHLPKTLYLLPFTVNSQEQIITTINKRNLQRGGQTLDIYKYTVSIKASLCWMWLPHSWVCLCWWPQLSLCHGEAPLDSASPGRTSGSRARAPSPTISQTGCLQFPSYCKFLLWGFCLHTFS